MVKRVTKYRRYVPTYRKDLRWRQTMIDVAFIAAFLDARDQVILLGMPVGITGFGGWKVTRVLDSDFASE